MTVDLAASLDEIYEYFNDPKVEVRKMAVELLAGLSNSQEEQEIIKVLQSDPTKYISRLFSKLSDQPQVAAVAWDAIINYSIHKEVALYLIDRHWDRVILYIQSREVIFAEAATKLLSNLSKYSEFREEVFGENLLFIIFPIYLAGPKHNPNCDYAFLASTFADVTNTRTGRLYFLQENFSKLVSLLPDLHSKSVIRRGGIASLIKNCLFETDFHESIFEKEINDDFLVTTLAGCLYDSQKSKLSEEEKEALPVELQLADHATAEEDLVVRAIIVECLIILGTTRRGRDVIRAKSIYPILREWHLLECDSDMKALVEKLVELIIRDEGRQ